jgi:hypothetical protein
VQIRELVRQQTQSLSYLGESIFDLVNTWGIGTLNPTDGRNICQQVQARSLVQGRSILA